MSLGLHFFERKFSHGLWYNIFTQTHFDSLPIPPEEFPLIAKISFHYARVHLRDPCFF
jgi:hypothetical protein